jgi:hypothetical protein
MGKLNLYRQGDIFIVKTDSIPTEAKEQEAGIIVRGEVTGHTHRISDGAKAALMVAAGIAYIRAQEATDIVHDEHSTITLPPGDYRAFRQREYTPEGWRQVAD